VISALVLIRIFPSKLGNGNASYEYMVICCSTDALHLRRYAISALVLTRIFPSKLGNGNASYEYMAICRFTDALHLCRATGKGYVARLSIVESFH
jgi:hypothetical protein